MSIRTFFLAGLTLFTFSSCAPVPPHGAEGVPPVKIDSSIGRRMLARTRTGRVFNGDFELGTAGWALKYYVNADHVSDPDLPCLRTVARADNAGQCLEAPSIPGADYYWLAGREVYLQKGMRIELSYEARLARKQGCSPIRTFFLDFRNFTQYRRGMSTSERYWLNAISLRISDKWQTAKKVMTIPRNGYYFFRFVIQSKDRSKPLPTIHIDSVKFRQLNGKSGCLAKIPQIAIREDRPIPAYQRGLTVQYDIRATFPKAAADTLDIWLDLIDDQFFTPALSRRVTLTRSSSNVFAGKCRFTMNRYGSYSTRVRSTGRDAIDSFGGDILVLHPVLNHSPSSIAAGIGVNSNFHRFLNEYKHPMFYVMNNRMQDYYDILRVSGIGNVRSWNFRWKLVEQERGKFDFSFIDKIVPEYRKRNIELIGTLGVCFAASRRKRAQNLPEWLIPLCGRHKTSKKHNSEAFVPPFDLWEKYCRAMMQHYRNEIKVWEVFNEPNEWMTPENYLQYVKAARRAADAVKAGIKVIGPCPTGDFAADRFAGWSKEFIALGGEKYIDGFAYHPYGASNDFQKGKFFEATSTINGIRSWLRNKSMPLYNTECYHMPNLLRLRTTQGEASTILRHYLITLGMGVRFSASIAYEQLCKYRMNSHVALDMCHNMESVPAPVAAALNNLAFHLRDLTRAEPVKANKFVNSYIFSGAPGAQALGVAWDLRPMGSAWTSGASVSGLQFMDMWGNRIAYTNAGIPLSLDPVYITGPEKAVRAFLTASRFRLSCPLAITGRFFGRDLYLSANNLSGMSFRPSIRFAPGSKLRLPASVQFAFSDLADCSAFLPGALPDTTAAAAAAFTVFVNNEDLGNGKIRFLPQTPAYSIPCGNAKPLLLKLPEGSEAQFLAADKHLQISVKVRDTAILRPRQYAPWSGDAVEIFIDTAPFARLDRDLIRSGDGRLPVYQYIIPATPYAGEPACWSSSKNLPAPQSTVTKSADGYTVSVRIPWEALLSSNRYGIYGIDIEVDHLDKPGAKLRKETLSNNPSISYKQRLHYPLFKVPGPARLSSLYYQNRGVESIRNGSFETALTGRGNGWRSPRSREQMRFAVGAWGYNATKGAMVKLDEPEPRHVRGWSQVMRCHPGGSTRMVLEGFVKLENLKVVTPNPGGAGLKFFLHFYDEVHRKHLHNLGIGVREDITGSTGWQKLQCIIQAPPGATRCQLSCGLSTGVTGTVYFDDIHLKTLPRSTR